MIDLSGFSRDRNIKVPKKAEKKSSVAPSNYLPSRPAEGRVAVPKKVAQPPKSKPKNQQSSRRGNNPRSNRVAIVLDGGQQMGMPHRRFHGRTGFIEKRQGVAWVVSVKDGNMQKTVIARPEHLRPLE